jgi:glycosyltransferase involved in cell wall biosynthesis
MIASYRTDKRLRYIHSETKGLGQARNIGLAHAQGDIVAFTDDDCTVPTMWLRVMAETFAENPRVTVAFCNVKAAPHNHNEGFIPTYMRQESKLVRSFWDKCRARGIGAGIAVQREAALTLGGFDEALGSGGHFPSCEDGDMAMRALANNQWVYETHAVTLTHHGFRTWIEGRELTRRDWLGIGAAYAKPLRCGHWGALIVVLYESIVMGILKPLLPLLQLKPPRGLRRILYFIIGFMAGLTTPIDREHMVFRILPQK